MNSHLFFSIVIPTYNRPERLEKCLQSMTQLEYPCDRFEVIVVDDGSQMPLTNIIAQFETEIALRLIRQDNAGPASARNTGAAAAQGTYLVFTDDDCQPHSHWLSALAESIADRPDALIGGCTVNALPENLYSTTSQLLIDYLYHYYNQVKGEATFFASNNFAVPRNAFQRLGGFDTSFPLAAGEDREFCDRWRYHQMPMEYAPEMKIDHGHRLSLASFWRQHFNYGRGAFCFHTARAKRVDGSVKVEPFTFYTGLLTYPFRRSPILAGSLMASLLVLSQVANVVGFFWERTRQRQPAALAPHKI